MIPAILILLWIGVGATGGPYFGKISQVSVNDQTAFLPGDSESAEVQAWQTKFYGTDTVPAIAVLTRPGPLTEADKAFIAGKVDTLTKVDGVATGASPAIFSADGKAAQVILPLRNDGGTSDVVDQLRTRLSENLPQGLHAYITGPAGQAADLAGAFAGIDGALLLVAILAVLIILVIVYRSPLLPLIVLGTSMFALCASVLTVYWLAKDGILALNGQAQGILFILVIGAATDYSLLYVSRYREMLRDHQRRWDATWGALKTSIQPIAASAATVIAGVLCLLFSELNSNKTLGPVAAIGIVFAFLSAMTMLPALLLVAGRVAFWPRRPKAGSAHPELEDGKGLWPRVSRSVARRPRVIWIGCVVLLGAASMGLLQLQASGVSQSDIVEGYSQARDGQAALGKHFPAGSGSPVVIIAPSAGFVGTATTALAVPGVEAVTVRSADSPSGSASVTAAGVQAFGALGAPAPVPTVIQGKVLLSATLSHDPNSDAAETAVGRLRADFAGTPEVLVGGATATVIDTNAAGAHDRDLIIPLVLLVILLILMLLLRAILAPLLLIGSVALSFAATMGISALVFNHVFHFAGADSAVPLYGFIFLVALGVDYNIFLMTRVREESVLHGTRPGILRGLSITGGIITSAGIILAATFAALAVIPVLFLSQLAFIVGFGVLLDTFLVRSLLVPALSYDIGARIWWPSRLARDKA